MNKETIQKGIFINNLEAVDIANHIERERGFKLNYKGVLPYSLELIKLDSLKDFGIKKYVDLDNNIYGRLITDDVINVKFSCGQMDKQETIYYITKQTVKRVLKQEKYYKKKEAEYLYTMKSKFPKEYKKYKDIIDKIIADDKHEYNKTNADDLRHKLYTEGFTITKTFYPILTKGHEKYNKEVVEAIKTQKKLIEDIEKNIKKSKNVIENNKLENQKEEIEQGIKIIFENLETENTQTRYKMWKRSGSKSRTGQVLYIKESLLEDMNNWGRMALNLPTDEIIDVVGLSAYSSLVGSHIEGTLSIKPSNILIVPDVLSYFNMKANVIRKQDYPFKNFGKVIKKKSKRGLKENIKRLDKKSILNMNMTTIEYNRYLKMYKEDTKIESSLFDGQSLLDSRYFKKGQSMMLLRQAFFKSASFNTEVVQFLKDYFGDRYDTAEIKDMFGNRIRVNQVHMIVTPNSLKALKFSKYCKQDEQTKEYIGTEKDMYNYWKSIVKNDSNVFGICKHEKESKQGHEKLVNITKRESEQNFKSISRKAIKDMNITTIDRGNIIQQMSYQHLNSLRADKEDIKSLLSWEIEYINSAKSKINVYKDLLLKGANYMNSNLMIADLCDTDYINTEMFRKQRSKTISKYVSKIKGGKVKINGDNCTIIGSPYIMLLHSIGGLKEHGELNNKGEFILDDDFEDITLPSNDKYISCYTKLYKHNEVITEFRNPHTSYSNIGLLQNVREKENLIDKYFNFSKNIIAVNLIKTEFQVVNSGLK